MELASAFLADTKRMNDWNNWRRRQIMNNRKMQDVSGTNLEAALWAKPFYVVSFTDFVFTLACYSITVRILYTVYGLPIHICSSDFNFILDNNLLPTYTSWVADSMAKRRKDPEWMAKFSDWSDGDNDEYDHYISVTCVAHYSSKVAS